MIVVYLSDTRGGCKVIYSPEFPKLDLTNNAECVTNYARPME